MKNKLNRKKLLTEKYRARRIIGYARSADVDMDYLNEQIKSLKDEGCIMVFSEIASFNEVIKPELDKALESLSEGDLFVLTKLDRAFQSKSECIKIINKLLNRGIRIRTLSGYLSSDSFVEILPTIFDVLIELENLEKDILKEKKKEALLSKKLFGENLGGRPKIDPLKESLVIRLRNEGFSYRAIRSQTGIALSTIRRIIIDSRSL